MAQNNFENAQNGTEKGPIGIKWHRRAQNCTIWHRMTQNIMSKRHIMAQNDLY